MTDLPTHPTRIEKVLIEGPVPAWVDCEKCYGAGLISPEEREHPDADDSCPACRGTRGKWHQAVVAGIIQGLDQRLPYIGEGGNIDKSSQLQRKWEICIRCGNANHKDSCPDCLNYKEESTGAKPGTAGPWEVVR